MYGIAVGKWCHTHYALCAMQSSTNIVSNVSFFILSLFSHPLQLIHIFFISYYFLDSFIDHFYGSFLNFFLYCASSCSNSPLYNAQFYSPFLYPTLPYPTLPYPTLPYSTLLYSTIVFSSPLNSSPLLSFPFLPSPPSYSVTLKKDSMQCTCSGST